MSDFKREERYVVVKLKRLSPAEQDDLRNFLAENDVPTEECVVVESDWPNYEHVWKTVEQVSNGAWQAARAQQAGSGEAVAYRVTECPGLTYLVDTIEDAEHGKAFYGYGYEALYTHPSAELAAARGEAERLGADLDTVHEAFGIGNKARSLTVLVTNIESVKRFAEYLHAVEQKFFMVPCGPDEDCPDCEPDDECLVNSWGSTKDRYLKQFEAAILRKQAEAVENFGNEKGSPLTMDGRRLRSMSNQEAQRLRQQADDLDNV